MPAPIPMSSRGRSRHRSTRPRRTPRTASTAAIAQLAASGDEIVVGDDVYGGTYRYLERVHRPGGAAEARYADLSSGSDGLWEQLTARTRLVWFETPSNPHLKLTDIGAAAAAIRERAAQSGEARPWIVVDNTFASPALQNPLELGADIVFHSATKYLGGHSDTILGIAVTRDAGLAERVYYPGLATGRHAHPGNALVGEGRQMRGGGGMVSFVPSDSGGRSAAERAVRIAESTRLFTLAESLGGVESLIEVPATMTHA